MNPTDSCGGMTESGFLLATKELTGACVISAISVIFPVKSSSYFTTNQIKYSDQRTILFRSSPENISPQKYGQDFSKRRKTRPKF